MFRGRLEKIGSLSVKNMFNLTEYTSSYDFNGLQSEIGKFDPLTLNTKGTKLCILLTANCSAI